MQEAVSGVFVAQINVPFQYWHIVDHEKGFQRTSTDASPPQWKPSWIKADDGSVFEFCNLQSLSRESEQTVCVKPVSC